MAAGNRHAAHAPDRKLEIPHPRLQSWAIHFPSPYTVFWSSLSQILPKGFEGTMHFSKSLKTLYIFLQSFSYYCSKGAGAGGRRENFRDYNKR